MKESNQTSEHDSRQRFEAWYATADKDIRAWDVWQAALAVTPQTPPESADMVTVPREPTHEMIAAMLHFLPHTTGNGNVIAAYRAMLKVVPVLPVCPKCKGTGCIDTPFSDSDPSCDECSGEGVIHE